MAKHQAGISFLQVGDLPEASEFLRSLDDDLEEQHGVRDMVDCRQYEGAMDADFILFVARTCEWRADDQARPTRIGQPALGRRLSAVDDVDLASTRACTPTRSDG